MIMRFPRPLLALAGLALLAACHKSQEGEMPALNNEAEDNAIVVLNETENSVPEAPERPRELANAAEPRNVAKPAPPPPVSEEQQTLDDADATGLTSRIPDESATPAAPAQSAQ
jgi:hypothetical protein